MFRLINTIKLFTRVKTTFFNKVLRTMSAIPKVTVRCAPDEDVMQVSFIYVDDSLMVNRRFNLNRQKNEEIRNAFARIRANITTIYEKKKTKKNKKVKVDSSAEAIPETEQLDLVIKIQHGNSILSEDTKNTEAWTDGAILTVGNTIYQVLFNAPIVKSISLPKSIMAGYPVYPKVDLEFTTVNDTQFDWLRNVIKKDVDEKDKKSLVLERNQYWQKVATGYYYIPSNDDIGKLLKVICVPGCNAVTGHPLEAISSKEVEAGPGYCPFETRHLYTKNLTERGYFRCLSYNILADLYADSDFTRTSLFPYCPPYALEIDYRKQLFLKEIIEYKADLICLQEVDKKVFFGDLQPVLSSANLEGVFNLKGGQVAEGLATFYRRSKFRLIKNEAIILAEYLPNEPLMKDIYTTICNNEKLKDRFMARTTAMQISLLQSVEDENQFLLIGNTHLYFHPDADHVRLLQATVCIKHLEEKLKNLKTENPDKSYSLILSGDFNSTPEWGVYRLMTTGYIPKDIIDWKSNLEQSVTDLEVSHGLSLGSACGCPDYTNYTQGFNGCLDYIYYDQSQLEVTEVIPMPTHEEVTQNIAIPNINFPSDHIAIGCTMKFLS